MPSLALPHQGRAAGSVFLLASAHACRAPSPNSRAETRWGLLLYGRLLAPGLIVHVTFTTKGGTAGVTLPCPLGIQQSQGLKQKFTFAPTHENLRRSYSGKEPVEFPGNRYLEGVRDTKDRCQPAGGWLGLSTGSAGSVMAAPGAALGPSVRPPPPPHTQAWCGYSFRCGDTILTHTSSVPASGLGPNLCVLQWGSVLGEIQGCVQTSVGFALTFQSCHFGKAERFGNIQKHESRLVFCLKIQFLQKLATST